MVRARIAREPDFLCATEADLIGEDEATYDRALFPDQAQLGQTRAAAHLRLSAGRGERRRHRARAAAGGRAAHHAGKSSGWCPGCARSRSPCCCARCRKRSAGRSCRWSRRWRRSPRAFEPGAGDFLTALAEHLSRTYGVPVRAADWPPQSLPAASADAGGNRRSAATRRSPRGAICAALRAQVESGASPLGSLGARRAAVGARAGSPRGPSAICRNRWRWRSRGRAAARVPGAGDEGGRRAAAPLSQPRGGARARARRRCATSPSWRWREKSLQMQKELVRQTSSSAKPAGSFQTALEQLSAPAPTAFAPETAGEHLLRHALVLESPLTAARFEALLADGAARAAGPRVRARRAHEANLAAARRPPRAPHAYPALKQDVERLVPADFLPRTPPAALGHLPRYLKAIAIRAERAAVNPAKDAERERRCSRCSRWRAQCPPRSAKPSGGCWRSSASRSSRRSWARRSRSRRSASRRWPAWRKRSPPRPPVRQDRPQVCPSSGMPSSQPRAPRSRSAITPPIRSPSAWPPPAWRRASWPPPARRSCRKRGSPAWRFFARRIFPQRHRGFFGEFARRDEGRLAEIGLWPAPVGHRAHVCRHRQRLPHPPAAHPGRRGARRRGSSGSSSPSRQAYALAPVRPRAVGRHVLRAGLRGDAARG